MSDDKLPPLDKVIAACKIGHKYFGPDPVDLAAAAWLERQQTEIERLRKLIKRFEPALNCTSCDPCIYPECRRGHGK